MLTRRQLIGGAIAAPVALRREAVHSVRASDPLRVVATFSVLGDLARNVGGDAISLRVIVGPDGDAHTFEPSPQQIGWIADADLIVENGLGFEPWLEDMYSASGSAAIRVIVTSAITPINRSDEEESEAHPEQTVTGEEPDDHGVAHDHGPGEFDPHVWQDVQNAILQVGTIRDALLSADSANASVFASHADAYLTELQALNTWVRQAVGAGAEALCRDAGSRRDLAADPGE